MHQRTRNVTESLAWLPGVACAVAVAIAGKWLAAVASARVAGLAGLDPAGPDALALVSGIGMAVVLGLVLRNTLGVPVWLRRGVAVVIHTGLRVGIVLLGFKLVLATAGRISIVALPVAVACIASALALVSFVSARLGLPPRLGALIAVGTSVCGVTAIVATGPAIGATEDETSYAVACVTIFGLLALFTYPWLAHAAFASSPMLAGVFLGTSIHDTSQVAGAAMIYQEAFRAPLALEAATVTKLLRNVSMAVLIPVVAIRFRSAGRRLALRDVRSAVPAFVVLFLAAIVIRSAGDALVAATPASVALDVAASWKAFLGAASSVSSWALAAALAGVGMNTDLGRLRQLGLKPLLAGFTAALVVGAVSLAGLAAMAGTGLAR